MGEHSIQKLNGLVFLHALTLLKMAPSKSCSPNLIREKMSKKRKILHLNKKMQKF